MKSTLAFVIMSLLAAGVIAAQDETITLSGTAYQTINVRSGPDTQYEIVGRVAAGDTVQVNGRDAEEPRWLHIVSAEDMSGWVAVFAVIVEGDLLTLPVVSQVETTPPPDENYEAVSIIAYGRVNVRNGPGLTYTITDQLDVGDTLFASARSDTDNNWLYFESSVRSGWVAYFTVAVQGNANTLPILVVDGSGNMFVPPDEVVIANFNISLRAEPDSGAVILTTVPFQTNVTPLAISDDALWIYVLSGETVGWGMVELFDITPEQMEALPRFAEVVSESPEITPAPAAQLTPTGTPDIAPTSTPDSATVMPTPDDESG